MGNWNFEKVESTTESTGMLIFRFVVRRQDVQYFAINPSVVIYTYAKNYQLAIVIVRHVKGIKEIPCIRSFQTIPIRFAELSHACAFTIRARVSRCSLLAMSMAYPLACYWHEQVRPENSSTLVPHGWNDYFQICSELFREWKRTRNVSNYIFRVYFFFKFLGIRIILYLFNNLKDVFEISWIRNIKV